MSTNALLWLLVPCFTLLTAFGAFLKFPLPGSPVPVTLQTFFVLVAGLLLGPVRGSLSQGLYLILSTLGLPILATTPSIAGPAGGYVVGFVLAAAIMGFARKSSFDRISVLRIVLFCLVAEALIFGIGLSYLKFWFQASWSQTFLWGLWPFVGGEILKVLAVVTLYSVAMPRSKA